MHCRFCKNRLSTEFVNLGSAPASNSFLTEIELNEPETYYPLKVYVCDSCFLVQIDEYKKSETIFNNQYVYFSSYSSSWLAHSKRYVDMAEKRFGLSPNSLAVEIASNDGYLLQYFVEKGIPVLGIEPTANTAKVAREKGVESWIEFFGVELATRMVREGKQADLLLGNNVLAHVPDLNDFVGGLKIALKQTGVITMEFPHLMQLVEHNQFDTIYHEHFSYLSLLTVREIFAKHDLTIFDVEEIQTHGGSLRIFAKHTNDATHIKSEAVEALTEKEVAAGMNALSYYQDFQKKVNGLKNDFLNFLLTAKKQNRIVAAYGAAAKGNTLLNYCGIKTDLIDFVVDANPNKQDKFLPGSHIPVCDESRLKVLRPNYIVIFPWNIREEIVKQLDYVKSWGAQFVTAVPYLQHF